MSSAIADVWFFLLSFIDLNRCIMPSARSFVLWAISPLVSLPDLGASSRLTKAPAITPPAAAMIIAVVELEDDLVLNLSEIAFL